MKHSIFIFFLLHFTIVSCLKGSVESICYVSVRMAQTIEIGPGQFQTIYDRLPTAQCCPGYDLENDECIPRCSPPCKNGVCVQPNTCACPENYYGPSCESRKCPAGYEGPDCDRVCTRMWYGQNCENYCMCQNGDCDPITGYCDCPQGWSGFDCSIKCPDDMQCLNNGVCNPDGKHCICPPGYTGQYCEKMCEENFWGSNCSQSCNCDDNHICNRINGQCQYNCVNGEYLDDTCWCNNGWTGDSCTEKLCPMSFYGENCDSICSCHNATTKTCDRITGACICKPGWTGHRCEELCPVMSYGEDCNYSCECVPSRHNGCDPVSGMCSCKAGWTGETCSKICTCEHGDCDSYGNCICSSGWQGNNCQEKCDDGYYGEGCSYVCALYNDQGHFVCHHIRGPICAPGWTGLQCADPCPDGTYGIDCQNCTCESYYLCDRFSGECVCPPGWYGSNCEIACPMGLYGFRCDATCKCSNCRPTDGYCACQPGWNSSFCQEYCPEQYFDLELNQCVDIKIGTRRTEPFISNRLKVIVGVTAAVLLVFIGFVVWKCRSRLKRKPRRSIEGNSDRPLFPSNS